MKKAIIGIAFMASLGAATAVSALDLEMSAGGAGFIASNFGGGNKLDAQGVSADMTMRYFGGGICLFFDAQYAEVSAGLRFTGGSVKAKNNGNSTMDREMATTDLALSLLFKYPFFEVLSPVPMTVFPVLGIAYDHCVTGTLDGVTEGEAGDLSRLWFKFGAGADYSLNDKMYLRPALLYGFGLENGYERNYKEDMKSKQPGSGDTKLSHGLTVKFGVGFKL
jgi:hypothetical protein